ncbi:unnamed protein product, partial [Symbiodinium sp. CCMP2592]
VMATYVANTARGVTATGDFVWTSPQIVHGVAHLLHVPSGSTTSTIFWLLHYRGRAAVMSVPRAVFDWQHVGQTAAEEFGLPFFSQGQFGIWHGGRVIPFGSQLPAPGHGTIITLVRNLPVPAAGFSSWDAPSDAPASFHFDYDLCRGAGGELPLAGETCLQVLPSGMSQSPPPPAEAAGPSRTAPTRWPTKEPHSAPPSVVRQVNEISHQLTMLTSRLEVAGVLPGSEPDEVGAAPWFHGPEELTNKDKSTARTVHPVAQWGVFLLGRFLGQSGFVLGVLSAITLVRGDGEDSAPSEPSQPSSPDLAEVTAPTPAAELVGTGGEDTHLLRPSDEDAARTGAPVVGQWPAVAPTFDHASIPTLQGRVIAFMCEVDDRSNRNRPFLPAGCPLTIHNPFTVSDQCSVVTPLVGSGQEFRFLLQDFSGRRGWQQILPVQPQPDTEAVHLIPAAADSALASVVLRTHRGLHPVCLPATLPVGPTRALTLGGRFGRLREPYPLRRNVERPVHLRDGDCLLLDSGPFGPPPPTPVVTSGAAVLPMWILGGLSFRYVPMRLLVFLPAVQAMLQWTDTLRPTRRDTVEVGSFAWRDARFDRTFEGIVSQPRLRCVLLCPLTGMQGPHEIATRTVYPALLGHYQAVHGDWIRDVVPVWPGLFRDRLVLVPDIGADPRCVCIVACHSDTARAFLVPGRCTFDCLLRTLRHLSGWPIMHLGVSPAVRSSLPNPRTWELNLRTADVLEVFTGTKDVNAFVPQMPLSLVSQVRWTAPFVVAETDLVGVWSPVHGGPIFTRVDAGAFWTPEDRTFEGSFRSRWPGSWVPIPWHPGNCVHLMQASTSPGRAHIIHESREGVVALAFTARTSRSELAEELHSLPEYMAVLGATPEDTIAPLVLRDGDVVLDSYVYEQRWLSVWNRGRRWGLDASVGLSIALLIAARQPSLFGLLVGGLPTAEAVRRGRSRTPSSAHSSADSDDDLSPRASHYHILSPFHSGAFPAYFTREVAGTTLDGLGPGGSRAAFSSCVLGACPVMTDGRHQEQHMFSSTVLLVEHRLRRGMGEVILRDGDRALHESIPGAFNCRLLSPFGVRGDPVVVMRQNDTVEEVRMALTGSEPVWSHEIVPVWPSPSPDQLVFVPVAPSPAMACLVVLSVEWQMPVLIPNRADLAWLLDFIRGMSPGPLFSLRGPPAAVGPVTSAHEAVRWRDGDLVLAFPTDFDASALEVPVFRADEQRVKWTFLWSYGDQGSARYVHAFGTLVSGARALGWRGYLAFLLLFADAYSAQAMREAPPRDTGQPRHCLWCPAHGRLGPFLDAATALYATGWNSLDVTLAPVRPAPLSIDSHWVPGLGIRGWATIVIVGAPAPRALLVPTPLTAPALRQLLQPLFGSVRRFQGNAPELSVVGPASPPIHLQDGSCLRIIQDGWAPSLAFPFYRTFSSLRSAVRYGFWSDRLEIAGGGWIILWRRADTIHRILRAQSGQQWHPARGALLPAMSGEPEGWWPWDQVWDSADIIHMSPTSTMTAASPLSGSQVPRESGLPTATSNSARSNPGGLPSLVCCGLLAVLWWRGRSLNGREATGLLCILACYLAAWGAPLQWHEVSKGTWELDVEPTCQLQAQLHQGWWSQGLGDLLPGCLSSAYHTAWQAYPAWEGGPPDSLLIATDGSGEGPGAWAFLVWGLFRHKWFRLGWAAATLPVTPWLPGESRSTHPGLRSFHSELAALQAAGHWCAAMLDLWQLRMRHRPTQITIVVDNSSALQVAAGQASAATAPAQRTRLAWQVVQARVTTHFRHVHSHVGVLVNTLADAVAGVAVTGDCDLWVSHPHFRLQADLDFDHFPWLWVIPQSRLREGRGVFSITTGQTDWLPPVPSEDKKQASTCAANRPLGPLHLLTANIQSIKDPRQSVFNPSGHGARRQYLYRQLLDMHADIVCLQETRAPAGRWATGGWLSWRSGADRGQYGCEIWVRPDIVSPPLSLASCKILKATPRLLVITCVDERLPLTIFSAHAPHQDRPLHEAKGFWSELHQALHQAPRLRPRLLGIDANADFCAQDVEEQCIGSLIAAHPPTSNDEFLFEFVTVNGLDSPATFPEYQDGQGWSWEHTGGKRKRLDHLLFSTGDWQHHSTAQAWDFDIVNSYRDHVALRSRSTLFRPSPVGRTARRRAVLGGPFVEELGRHFWEQLPSPHETAISSGEAVFTLQDAYRKFAQQHASSRVLKVRQPYLAPETVRCLYQLRDWRCQLRHSRKLHRQHTCRWAIARWRRRPRSIRLQHLADLRMARHYTAALAFQEAKAQDYVHGLARKDKQAHFLALTTAALQHWHAHGRPMESINHLKWAARRAAERRQVYAAGGYDIDEALEEQFRLQEAGIRTDAAQVGAATRSWLRRDALPCTQAVPSLLQAEDSCRRQAPNKAPGPDGVPNAIWHHFPAQAGRWVWAVNTKIALSGHEPFGFKEALYFALYKKGPAAIPANYRAIALLNGVAKIWHSHLRRTIGKNVLQGYADTQLGGKPGVPVSFAVAAYRAAIDLSTQLQRSTAVLFVDIQAAYYEVSRQLIFCGDAALTPSEDASRPDLRHLTQLVDGLLSKGALEQIGMVREERELLQDCVAFSRWSLAGSASSFIATRGSRPGDGLADILFGALFSVALRHIQATCLQEGISLQAAGSFVGASDEVLPLGWADDLAILADFDSPRQLLCQLPRLATIVLATLEVLRFRVNLAAGKTEILVDVRGPEAKIVRGELLAPPSLLRLPSGHAVRLAPEYRYLGVVQTPRDNGRRDMELAAQRGHSAWSHAKSLLACQSLPWRLKQAWLAGRVLPAAYATLCTSLAVSERAVSPLTGFLERAARQLIGSWKFGHVLTNPLLVLLMGLSSPGDACAIARTRLVVQLVTRAPPRVGELFAAAWDRATPWCSLLVDACQQVASGLVGHLSPTHVTRQYIAQHAVKLQSVCRHLSRYGSAYRALHALWRDVVVPKVVQVLGVPQPRVCGLCGLSFPSLHALAAHVHRKHSVVNSLTRYTNGTVCLWCHCDHHSTDRLKYHLKVTPACMHGLRVTVGQAYVYGTGTKRSGARGHRGLPATRLPGPINATPAQRAASLAEIPCTEDDLCQERQAIVGTHELYSWPEDPAPLADVLPADTTDVSARGPGAPALTPVVSQLEGTLHWFAIEALKAVQTGRFPLRFGGVCSIGRLSGDSLWRGTAFGAYGPLYNGLTPGAGRLDEGSHRCANVWMRPRTLSVANPRDAYGGYSKLQ